jgi:hypothetical protein
MTEESLQKQTGVLTIKERLMNKEQWDENASERCENISKSDIGNKTKGE